MSNGNLPRDEAELENFLRRQSPLSEAYGALDAVDPPEVLDGKILAMARGAASSAASPAASPAAPKATAKPESKAEAAQPVPAAAGKPSSPKPVPASGASTAAKEPAARPPVGGIDDDDEEPDGPVVRRPRWLVPAALAASVLVAVGVGVSLLGDRPSDSGVEPDGTSPLKSMFAKRARERDEAEKAAAEAAAAASQEAEVELAPLPPPPFFEPEGPQVQDLDTAIALIRKELVLANQLAAIADEAKAGEQELQPDTRQARVPAGAAGLVADAAAPGSSDPAATAAEATSAAGVIQPRDRRLAKILELYDGGNPDLAAASLEIFLRDFEDDPISQRIIDAQPKPTDVAVE